MSSATGNTAEKSTRGTASTQRRVVAIILTTAVASGCLGGYQQHSERAGAGAAGKSPLAADTPATGAARGAGGTVRAVSTAARERPAASYDWLPDAEAAVVSDWAEASGDAYVPGRYGQPGHGHLGAPDASGGAGGPGEHAPRVNCAKRKCIALTFDDGPGPYTGKLLNILAARRVHATFFLLGSSVSHQPNLVRRISREGHEIGNHSYTHPDLTGLSTEEVEGELGKTQQAIYGALGRRPRLLRPPYGSTDEHVLQVAKKMRMPQIFWTVDTLDWQIRESAPVAEKATSHPGRGGIILMHDTRPTSVDAVPSIVDGLRRKGFALVTVPELNAGRPFVAGGRYRGGPS